MLELGRGVVRALVALTGCPYAAVQRLPLDDQAAFHTYNKVMTGVQVHTYLAKATPPSVKPSCRRLALYSAFQALDPADRAAVLTWHPTSRHERRSAPVPVGRPLLYGRRCQAVRPLVFISARRSAMAASGKSVPRFRQPGRCLSRQWPSHWVVDYTADGPPYRRSGSISLTTWPLTR